MSEKDEDFGWASEFLGPVSGDFKMMKAPRWPVHQPSERSARWNGVGTGSLYLAEDESTCETELRHHGVDVSQCSLYGITLNVTGSVLDLVTAGKNGHDVQQFMVPSGSNGYEVTRPLSDHVFAQGWAGIVYESSHDDGGSCLMLFVERHPVGRSDFEVLRDAGQNED